MEITAKTKLTCIIGNPVEHSLSPVIQNAAFKKAGLDCVYVALPVGQDNLPSAIETIREFFEGANVTMPYKQDVIPLMDEVSSYAKIVGAVNTIKVENKKLTGFNTDGRGFLQALEEEMKFSPEGKSVALIGAGGAARSIAAMLAVSNVKRLIISNRTIEKAQNLGQIIVNNFKQVNVDILSLNDDLPKSISDCDLIINATPVGMKGEGLPVKADVFKKGQAVADLIYQPAETLLLKAAKKAGARTMSGKAMLVYQGAASFEIWTETEAPVGAMKKALDEALADETS